MEETSPNYQRQLDIFIALLVIFEISEGVLGSGIIVTLTRWIPLFISAVFFYKTFINFGKEPMFVRMLMLLYLLFFVYGMVPIIEGKDFYAWRSGGRKIRGFLYLLQISNSLLPIFVFYYYSKIGALTKQYMEKRTIFLLSFVVVCFYLSLRSSLAESGGDEVQNNAGYLVVSAMPMLMFFKKNTLKQYALWAFCLLLILVSMKRGAIFVGFLVSFIFFLYIFSTSKRVSRLRVLFIFFVFALGICLVSLRMLNRSSYFQTRVENTMEGESSGRDVIYAFFFDYYLDNTTQEEKIFGLGANATLDIFGQYAHNDWLEIAINQGLLGIVIYLLYWVSFLVVCRKKELQPDVRYSLIMLFSISFLQTLFSMSYREYTLCSSMVLGYSLSLYYGVYVNTLRNKVVTCDK